MQVEAVGKGFVDNSLQIHFPQKGANKQLHVAIKFI